MYVLKDNQFEFVSGIVNGVISTTEDISKALFFKRFEEVDAFLKFCKQYDNCYYEDDFTIYELDFKEVD